MTQLETRVIQRQVSQPLGRRLRHTSVLRNRSANCYVATYGIVLRHSPFVCKRMLAPFHIKGEGKFLSVRAMKACGEGDVAAIFLILGTRCRYDQLYSPAALSPGAGLPELMSRKLAGPQSRYLRFLG
jgi:hypothetical protein